MVSLIDVSVVEVSVLDVSDDDLRSPFVLFQ